MQDRPVVFVTQGTVATDSFNQLLVPTLVGLSDEKVLVVATTANKPVEQLQLALPKNARVEPFIPYSALMPYVSVMVTNGGIW